MRGTSCAIVPHARFSSDHPGPLVLRDGDRCCFDSRRREGRIRGRDRVGCGASDVAGDRTGSGGRDPSPDPVADGCDRASSVLGQVGSC